MEFVRPKGLQGPMVYSTFRIKSKYSDETEEFLIQDLTENFYDVAVQIIVDNIRDGVFHTAAKTILSESGIRRLNEMFLNVFKEKISLICLNIDTMEIVGINAITNRESEVGLHKFCFNITAV